MPDTPRALGFRMPAEWEPHEATWIAWPHNRDDWPGRFAPVAWVYAEIVRKLADVERVRILVQDGGAEETARRVLRKAGANVDAVEFFHAPTDRSWTRDYCPLFVKNRAGEVALTNWRFNAWAKYDDWTNDAAIPATLAARLKLRAWEPGLVLEGGSIDVNGRGMLLTTEECLLSPVQARNPELTRREIEIALREYLGVRRVMWLLNGIAGDDTHGHVDDLARFVNANTVVLASEPDRTDPNYAPLRDNLAILRKSPLRVVKLPMPAPLIFSGRRLPASYANFYIANSLVLVPTFNDPNDRVALNTLARLFPDRTVTGINAVELVWGLGTLHCMTQQQPVGQASRPVSHLSPATARFNSHS
jgi:agmatine deiminase